MLLLSTTVLLALAVVLVLAGLRGRRTDDHPLCRRCGYDLTGRPDAAARCPECGADLARRRAIRVGHRVRRRALLAVGSTILVPLVAGLGVAGWAWERGIDPTPYKPAWWLRHDLDAGPALRAKSLAELTARVRAGHLSAGQAAAVADRALAAQAGAAPWDPAWGTFIEAAHAAGSLGRPQWATYARQAVILSLHVDEPHMTDLYHQVVTHAVIYQGERFTAGIVNDGPRPLVGARFRGVFDVCDFRMDGRPLAHGAQPQARNMANLGGYGGWLEMDGNVGGGFGYPPVEVDADASRRLPVGPHAMGATVRMLLYDVTDLSNADGLPHPLPDASKVLAALDVPVTGTFTIGLAPVLRADPARAAAMAASIQDVSVVAGPDWQVRVRGRLVAPPERAAFRISLRAVDGFLMDRDGTLLRGGMACMTAAGATSPFEVRGLWPRGDDATRVDVIFEPDLNAVADNVDPTPVWGEPVVVRDVRVGRPPLEMHTDPALRAAVAAAVSDVSISADPSFVFTVQGRIVAPPARVAFRVSVRLLDGAHAGLVRDLPDVVPCSRGATGPFDLQAQVHDDDATRADVTFRPEPEPGPREYDLTPIWGEPVVVRNVPIVR